MSTVPRVALSMLNLVPGGMGGSETYALELIRQLAATTDVSATAVVAETGAGFSEGLVPEIVIDGVRGGRSNTERMRALISAGLRAGRVRELTADADVVHYPFTVPVPRPARGQAFVQSLLDVQHLDLPHLFSRAERLYRRPFYEGGARVADKVITISEFAKRSIVEHIGIPEDRIAVAYLGVDADEFVPQLGPRQDFVLYPARGWKHKNHGRLLEAMELLRRDHGDLRLVLTGGGLDVLGELPPWVDRRGLVPITELRELYRTAAVLAYPSLYEGFGLPPLEAMASGCPVAATDAGSVPEVCGDAAVLFDAKDPESIAAGILSAISRASELTPRGLAHVRSFTWERCRDTHIEVYREVA